MFSAPFKYFIQLFLGDELSSPVVLFAKVHAFPEHVHIFYQATRSSDSFLSPIKSSLEPELQKKILKLFNIFIVILFY